MDNGRVLTSAGAAAGFDLCIRLVRRDLGAEAAAAVARLAVMPLERAGDQAQFITHGAPSDATASMGQQNSKHPGATRAHDRQSICLDTTWFEPYAETSRPVRDVGS